MTPTTWFLVLLAGWLGCGALLALALGRRGFDGFSWFLIGTVLGPMAVFVAWSSIRRDQELRPELLRTGRREAIPGVRVLIGFDGSLESRETINAVTRTLGGRLGRVALATVVPFDDAPEREAMARADLDDVRDEFASVSADTMLIHGHPATALAEEALQGGFDLIAIGATGHGRAHVFGSAAKELVQISPVPVLVSGQHVRAAAARAAR
jgi:nucleotide-binding universal stress UspA family protein